MSGDERLAAVLNSLAKRIESEAAQSARAGQYDRLMSIAVEVAALRDAGWVHRDDVAGALDREADQTLPHLSDNNEAKRQIQFTLRNAARIVRETAALARAGLLSDGSSTQALRDLADELDHHDDDCIECEPGDHVTRVAGADWIRDRADRLAAEQPNPGGASWSDLIARAARAVKQTETCGCADEPHMNILHDLAHDLAAEPPAPDAGYAAGVAAARKAVEAVHVRIPIRVLAGDCPDLEAHEHDESKDGDDLCWTCPEEGATCEHCFDAYEGAREWPCPTIVALDALTTEGEK